MNYIANKFLNELTDVLKENNENSKYDNDIKDVNIPFVISPLVQAIDSEKYSEFLKDIEKYPDYQILYKEKDNGYYSNGGVMVYLMTQREDYEYDEAGFDYSITFEFDQRDWGYCKCSPKDEGYREDKHCCGHGCDWWAPQFTINKIIKVGSDKWNGDEHDYWNFEDEFYNLDKQSKDEKEKKERELRIKELNNTIEDAKKKLEELMSK